MAAFLPTDVSFLYWRNHSCCSLSTQQQNDFLWPLCPRGYKPSQPLKSRSHLDRMQSMQLGLRNLHCFLTCKKKVQTIHSLEVLKHKVEFTPKKQFEAVRKSSLFLNFHVPALPYSYRFVYWFTWINTERPLNTRFPSGSLEPWHMLERGDCMTKSQENPWVLSLPWAAWEAIFHPRGQNSMLEEAPPVGLHRQRLHGRGLL